MPSKSLLVSVWDRKEHHYRHRSFICILRLSQVSLLRWLVMIFPYFTSHKMLRQLYGTIFKYLSFISLRYTLSRRILTCGRYISHLLFLLTTRSHVKTHRIQAMYAPKPDSLIIVSNNNDTPLTINILLLSFKSTRITILMS